MFAPFEDATGDPPIHGYLHEPDPANGGGIVLTHGAGGNCQSKLLVAVAEALAASGFAVLRFDLPFRAARRFGPPHPGTAGRDRQGLRRAASLLRATLASSRASGANHGRLKPGAIFLAGHSYGGRQASMLLAEEPDAADGLLLLSYPLHPPKKPEELRTQHFPQLSKPAFFVHGTRDPFATSDELKSTLALIPAPHALLEIKGAGHDLLAQKAESNLPVRIAQEFTGFLSSGWCSGAFSTAKETS
jgi:uncharacterized protein